MKLMQTNKGEFGYLKRERKRKIIIAAIMLGVPIFIFIRTKLAAVSLGAVAAFCT